MKRELPKVCKGSAPVIAGEGVESCCLPIAALP